MGVTLLFILSLNNAYPQTTLSKKGRKAQDNEAKADRLFIEGQRLLMLEEYEKKLSSFVDHE